MASFEKYKSNQAKFVYNHGCRKSLSRDKHVDPSLSYLNYSFVSRDFSYLAERLAALSCSKRKDVNVMAELIVTLPKDFDGSSREFFEKVYEFCRLKYKEDNIIYAAVHCDEPKAEKHIHVGFVPTYYDSKKKKAVVSYDRCVHRQLDKFHPQLSDFLQKHFGYDVGVLNGATKDGNKSVDQLKTESALREEIARLEAVRKRAEEECERALSIDQRVLVAKYRSEVDELKKRNGLLEAFLKQFGLLSQFKQWCMGLFGKSRQKDFEKN